MDVVLVHGAWQGAWAWERMVPLLSGSVDQVRTPTLAGAGARAGELTPHVDLRAHVADVVAAVGDAGRDVVLVAHSYAGMVVPDVVAARPGVVRAIVFVDAFYPDEGVAAIDQMPPPFRQLFRDRARDEGEGWRLPASESLLDVWGIHDQELRTWVGARLTDWSLRCFESPCAAPRSVLSDVPRWYVAGTADYPARAAFHAVAEQARADGATCTGLATGHDVMLEDPAGLAAVVGQAISAA